MFFLPPFHSVCLPNPPEPSHERPGQSRGGGGGRGKGRSPARAAPRNAYNNPPVYKQVHLSLYDDITPKCTNIMHHISRPPIMCTNRYTCLSIMMYTAPEHTNIVHHIIE